MYQSLSVVAGLVLAIHVFLLNEMAGTAPSAAFAHATDH
jgi:hypothetical protein